MLTAEALVCAELDDVRPALSLPLPVGSASRNHVPPATSSRTTAAMAIHIQRRRESAGRSSYSASQPSSSGAWSGGIGPAGPVGGEAAAPDPVASAPARAAAVAAPNTWVRPSGTPPLVAAPPRAAPPSAAAPSAAPPTAGGAVAAGGPAA